MVNKLIEELYRKLNQLDRDFKGSDWSTLKKSKFALVEEYREFPVVHAAGIDWVRFQ